jgi:hypothetical protein
MLYPVSVEPRPRLVHAGERKSPVQFWGTARAFGTLLSVPTAVNCALHQLRHTHEIRRADLVGTVRSTRSCEGFPVTRRAHLHSLWRIVSVTVERNRQSARPRVFSMYNETIMPPETTRGEGPVCSPLANVQAARGCDFANATAAPHRSATPAPVASARPNQLRLPIPRFPARLTIHLRRTIAPPYQAWY